MTHESYRAAVERADVLMKEWNGHSFITILKTRCQHCGRSPKSTGKCRHWFLTFVDILGRELMEDPQAKGGR